MFSLKNTNNNGPGDNWQRGTGGSFAKYLVDEIILGLALGVNGIMRPLAGHFFNGGNLDIYLILWEFQTQALIQLQDLMILHSESLPTYTKRQDKRTPLQSQ